MWAEPLFNEGRRRKDWRRRKVTWTKVNFKYSKKGSISAASIIIIMVRQYMTKLIRGPFLVLCRVLFLPTPPPPISTKLRKGGIWIILHRSICPSVRLSHPITYVSSIIWTVFVKLRFSDLLNLLYKCLLSVSSSRWDLWLPFQAKNCCCFCFVFIGSST